MDALLEELLPVRRALLESQDARREAASMLDALSESLLAIERAAAECTTHVAALAQENAVPAQAGQLVGAAFVETLAPLREAIEEVEDAFDVYPIQLGLAAVSDLGTSIGEAVEQSAIAIGAELVEFRSQLDEKVELLEGQAYEVAESSKAILEAIPEWVAERTGEVNDALEQVSQDLQDCREKLQELAGDARDAFNSDYLEEGVAAIDDVGGEMIATVDRLRDLGEKSIGETRDRVRGITDTMHAIVDLIEPAKPVLDMATAVA